MRHRSTHTYVEMEVDSHVYTSIAKQLRDAGYDHVFHDGVIDMTGIALRTSCEDTSAQTVVE